MGNCTSKQNIEDVFEKETLGQTPILALNLLPDEVIEKIMTYLSFSDLLNLRKEGGRLEGCAIRVLKKKPFKIAICGEFVGNIEEIAIVNDSISHLIPSIPSLPCLWFNMRKLFNRGTELPNGDFLFAGGGLVRNCTGSENCYWYLHYIKGSKHWKIVGTMKMPRVQYASVLIDGCLFTTGGIDSFGDYTSNLEKFSFAGGVEEKKNMPIALTCHTATMFGKHKMLVCGGHTSVRRFVSIHRVLSQRTFIYDVKANSWSEGPSLLTPRMYHCSCVIQSDDESTESIIIIGGNTKEEDDSNTTEILDLNVQKWVQGPALPLGARYTACVTLPPTSNFSCVVFGTETRKESSGTCVYGLEKRLIEWKLLGKFETRSWQSVRIALPFS